MSTHDYHMEDAMMASCPHPDQMVLCVICGAVLDSGPRAGEPASTGIATMYILADFTVTL